MSVPEEHNSGKTVPQNLRGLPDRGELDWFQSKGTDACHHRKIER